MESWDSALSQFPDEHNNTTQGGEGLADKFRILINRLN